ncbi:MAG: PP2C family protein-serine/threonine phosphatase [Flavobacteriales bacterium]
MPTEKAGLNFIYRNWNYCLYLAFFILFGLKQLWDKISYLGLSHIPKEEAVYQNRETVLINRITAVLAAVVVVYIPIEIVFNGLGLTHIILIQLALFCLVLFWNYKGYFEFAKYYFLFLILLIVATVPIVAPPEARNEYFAVPASIAGVLFFKEKWKSFLFMVISLALFYYIGYLRKSIPPMVEMEQELLLFFSQIFIAMVFLMNFIVVIYFRLTNEDYEKIIHNQRDALKKTNELVSEKNQEITDSINYAKRIQQAILPSSKLIHEYLPESFILYKPKDIVAGDFYWLESPTPLFISPPQLAGEMSVNGGQRWMGVLFACADCTGHGVPGAMVSVVCHNALNRSVREYGLTNPGKILDKTREIVTQEFEKSDEEVKDGMDISLCALQGNTLSWAGANNPLWIIADENRTDPSGFKNLTGLSAANGKTLYEIKSNKQPIGKVDNPQPFTTHTIELKQGDTFYIFTDGYQDQFGGDKGKKFKASKLKELLLSIQDKTMEEQKGFLDQAFEDWRGELEQVDDLCVIGVRI